MTVVQHTNRQPSHQCTSKYSVYTHTCFKNLRNVCTCERLCATCERYVYTQHTCRGCTHVNVALFISLKRYLVVVNNSTKIQRNTWSGRCIFELRQGFEDSRKTKISLQLLKFSNVSSITPSVLALNIFTQVFSSRERNSSPSTGKSARLLFAKVKSFQTQNGAVECTFWNTS